MSLLNMKLSVQAFVSACSPRVFFFFGPLWSPQWIISLNVLHHYIHEPPLKPPPFPPAPLTFPYHLLFPEFLLSSPLHFLIH